VPPSYELHVVQVLHVRATPGQNADRRLGTLLSVGRPVVQGRGAVRDVPAQRTRIAQCSTRAP